MPPSQIASGGEKGSDLILEIRPGITTKIGGRDQIFILNDTWETKALRLKMGIRIMSKCHLSGKEDDLTAAVDSGIKSVQTMVTA
jgi:hypothetical protein